MFEIEDQISENASDINISIKKINKYLSRTEALFLKQLYYWSSHRKSYGTEKWGRVWIYNTLDQWAEQLCVSKSSVRRAIESLKNKGIIDSAYLSANKRNRTLYYSINFDGINEYLLSLKKSPYVHIGDLRLQKNISNKHMGEHMYTDNNKHIINKSYKSVKNKIQNNSDQPSAEKSLEDKSKISSMNTSDTEIQSDLNIVTPPQKPTIIQDMIKIWNEEFSLTGFSIASSKMQLTKNLARFLVAAFKTKFKSCLKEWRGYLRTLKTSAWIMSEKFKLSIWWVIKFMTIDRIRAGELGVDSEKITPDKEELSERFNQHIESLDETEPCKKFRYKIAEKLSLRTYLSWFTHVSFAENRDSGNYGKVIMQADSQFVKDWISNNFAERCGLLFE